MHTAPSTFPSAVTAPEQPRDMAALENLLATPSPGLIADVAGLDGDLLVLGA